MHRAVKAQIVSLREAVFRPEFIDLLQGGDEMEYRAGRNHDSLRNASASGGEDHVGHVFSLHRPWPVVWIAPWEFVKASQDSRVT